MRSLSRVVICVTAATACAIPASAVTITQTTPAVDSNWVDVIWSSSQVGGHIEVDLQKAFNTPGMMGSPVVLEFELDEGDLGREIWIVHDGGGGNDVGEEVLNNTGVIWWDYHLYLVNIPDIPSWPFADAEFVTDANLVTSDAFGDPDQLTADRIDFSGGPVPDGNAVHFTGIRITHNGTEGDIFYLKQIPTPEPGTLLLLAAGAVAVIGRRARRRP